MLDVAPSEAERTGMLPVPYETLVVSDTGTGMDQATLQRIFEPFFTTKPTGQGTGLGLWMAHRFASECGGTVKIETAPGQGTTVRLVFPYAGENT